VATIHDCTLCKSLNVEWKPHKQPQINDAEPELQHRRTITNSTKGKTMDNKQQAFEAYALTNPEVKANPDLLKFSDGKYTNTVIEMHWQTYQRGRADEAAAEVKDGKA